MAEAIIKGLISASFIEAKNIIASDIALRRLEYLRQDYKIKITQDNREVVAKSDIVVIAVKPQVTHTVLNEIHDLASDGKLFISVAAGVPIYILEEILGRSWS